MRSGKPDGLSGDSRWRALRGRSTLHLMQDQSRMEIRLLLLAGLAACLAYPLGIFAPLPLSVRTVLLAWFGPLLGAGSYGFYRVLTLRGRSSAAAIGAASNALAGALFTAMIMVQLAAASRGESASAQATWLGLDVAWDMYIGVGTLLLAASAYGHEWFGRLLGGAGMIVAASLLSLNLLTFPTPPANAGLVDLGPIVGAWYLVVTIVAWRRYRRVEPGTDPEGALPGGQAGGDRDRRDAEQRRPSRMTTGV